MAWMQALNTVGESGRVSGPRILPYDRTNARIRAILRDIRTGEFARDLMQENAVGQPFLGPPGDPTTGTGSRPWAHSRAQ